MSFTAVFHERQTLPGDVQLLRFSKPEGYSFVAGQWSLLQLQSLGFNDERGLQRPLSITSAPEEDHIGFATKISESSFKQTLSQLETGAEVQIGKAQGDLCLPENENIPLCLLAGGIGITPFRSIAMHSFLADTDHKITLLYSSRTPEETPYLDEFEDLQYKSENFKFAATITRMHLSERSWNGREGRMDSQMIQDEFTEWNRGLFYVAGPPRMVETMLDILQAINVPEERIRVENFSGY